MSADRNLLYGMLAYQNGFVSREQLLDAFSAWLTQRDAPVGELLRQRASLTDDDLRFLDEFVQHQLDQPGEAALALPQPDPQARPDPEAKGGLATVTGPRPGPEAGTGLPEVVGRYRLARLHARGGLGEVHVAEDAELRREVALKRIQARFADDADSRRRFVQEAEVTGKLEHPGVVPVYGLVADATGHPCYAMRFIRGESLHDAIRRFHAADRPERDPTERSLTLRGLLGRFVAACNAVAFAHSRGVVHRDLKPSNIMLGDYGETLVVDWGLAKLMPSPDAGGERPTPAPWVDTGPAQTALGQAMGTVAFMPPEQARGDNDFVGPQSDVFSLGATLYCLLTGQPPYAGPDALQRAREGRVAPARQLIRGVPPALEAICNKAMAPWQAERYPTAGDLAQDVERWLADEPVSTYSEPLLTRAGRWARKRRTLVTTTAAVGLVTLVGLAVGLALVGGLNHRLDLANEGLRQGNERLTTALEEVERKRNEVKKERDIAVAVNDFLHDLLGQADMGNQPFLGEKVVRNPKITVAELLDRAAKNIDGKFPGQEETEAAIRRTIGDTYRALSKYEQALPQLQRSVELFEQKLGADHLHTLTCKASLAVLYHFQGKNDLAESLLLEVLRQREKKLGADHLDTLLSKNNLAVLYRERGKNDLAESLLLEVLREREKKLGANHPDTLTGKHNLATLYLAQGKYQQVETLLLEVLKLRQQKQGADHPSILNSKNSLAILYQAQGKYEQAESLLLEIIKQFEQKHGADHPYTLTSKSNLATLYWWMKKLDRSVPLLEQLLPLQEKKLGTDHPSTLQTLAHLGVNYRYAGRLDDAIRCLEVVQARSAKRSGGLPANLAPVPWELAVTYETAKQYAKAEPLYRAIMEQARQRFGPDDLRTASAMVQLGENLLAQQKPTDAEKLLRDTLRIREKAQPDAWTTFNTRSVLGAALLGQDKHAEAEPLLVQGYQGMKKREATIPSDVRTVRLKAALERLVALYDATGKKAEAANYRQELAALPKAAKEPTKK